MESTKWFYWQYSNSYIMCHSTDLFCHSILTFPNPIMLIHFLENIGRAHTPYDFPEELGNSASPLKHGGTFLKKTFMADRWRNLFWGKFIGELFYMRD